LTYWLRLSPSSVLALPWCFMNCLALKLATEFCKGSDAVQLYFVTSWVLPIGTQQISESRRSTPVFRGKADIALTCHHVRYGQFETLQAFSSGSVGGA
jgi:hypothetical protein